MELIKCNDDGSIEVMLIGRVAKLRRPKIGEFRDLRLALEDDAAAIADDQDWTTMETLRLAQLNADERVTPESVEAFGMLRERTKKVREHNESSRISWLIAVCTALDTTGRVPTEDEMPPEVLRGTWPGDMIKHWIGEAPLAPGDGSE